MLKRKPIPFVGGHFEERSSNSNKQQTINLFPEKTSNGKTPAALYCTQGLNLLGTEGDGVCRGNGLIFQEHAYFVNGSKLFKIFANWSTTVVGTLNTSSGQISMAENGSEIIIVDGTDGYLWDNATFSTISDADFPTCNWVTYLDTYFIVEDRGTVGQFFISAQNDGSTWATLDFANAESNPDDMFVSRAFHNEVWFFGRTSTEVHGNTGNVDFPFEPIRNATMTYGIEAEASLVQADNSLLWLAKNDEGGKVIVQARGFSPKIVSNRALEAEFTSYSTVTDCQAMSYQQSGHTFVVFTFPTADRTWVYDISQGLWHRRKTFNLGRHRMYGHIYFNNRNIVCDYDNTNFYWLDPDKYTDNGVTIERIRVSPYVFIDNDSIAIFEFEIDFEGGTALTTGQGSDPKAMLRYSKDGGHEWSNEIWRAMGLRGQYLNRARWTKLGKGREWIFEIKITDPIDVVILGAYIKAKVMQH